MVLRIYRSSIAKPTPRAAEEPDHVGEDHDGGWIPEKHARRPHGRDPEAVGEQVRRAARGVLLLPQPERLTRALCPARPRHPSHLATAHPVRPKHAVRALLRASPPAANLSVCTPPVGGTSECA